jgi:plasmid stability protein
MANLQVKGMDDNLYGQLKELAATENRSVSQEVIHMVKIYLASKRVQQSAPTPASMLLRLAGSWEDTRDAEQIIDEIRAARKNSDRLAGGF